MVHKLSSGYFQLPQFEAIQSRPDTDYAYMNIDDWNFVFDQVYSNSYNGPLVLKLDNRYYKTFPREEIDKRTVQTDMEADQVIVANENTIDVLFSTTNLSEPVEHQDPL